MESLPPFARLTCALIAAGLAAAASVSAGGGWAVLVVFPVSWALFYVGARTAWLMIQD